MIGAGRPPTDEQISQICACQLVSTRLAQAAPNGGSGVRGLLVGVGSKTAS